MRFTVDPAWDLEVAEGVTLGECRRDLAELTGVPVDAALAVGGITVRDSQVAGVPPWVAGSTVAVAGVGSAPRRAAAGTGGDWHVAVLAGAAAGTVGHPAGRRLVVGRAAAASGSLLLRDPGVSRRHAVVRRVGRWWVARGVGHARLLRLRRGRTRRLVWGLVRPTDRLVVGGTVLAVRAPTRATVAPSGPPAGPPATGRVGLAALAVPVAVGLGLAAFTRSPVYLLLALAGPATTGLPLLAARLKRRRPTQPDLGPEADSCRRAPAHLPPWWDLATEGLVVAGPPEAVAAAARALVGAALLAPELRLALLTSPRRSGDWAWCRWLESRLGGAGDAAVVRDDDAGPALVGSPLLVVVDEPTSRVALERWWLRGRGPSDGVLALARSGAEAPPWCRWTLTVAAEGSAVLAGPAQRWALRVPMGGVGWAEEHARWLAARDGAGPGTAAPSGTAGGADAAQLPATVGLAAVGLPTDVAGVRARWAAAADRGDLVVPVGIGAGGVVEVDLRADGPHALVAGTTGSGKSELLQAFVLGLALAHPPERLTMVLLDFKGGTGVGRCAGLPHVVGSVTDLDPTEAGRALEGLRAELRRRESVVAAAGAADACDVPGLPRLLVVVDEFQALVEDLPDFVPGLVRLAAQGRSLGFHLVLATQRPGGAVSPQMRANLSLRVCLRVTETGDSTDVVDVPTAALLPRDRPGRAVLRRGAGPIEVVQCPWVALPTTAEPVLRPAPDWAAFGPATRSATPPGGPATGSAGGPPAASVAARVPTDHAEQLAAVVRSAAATRRADRRAAGDLSVQPLWAPPLPVDIRRARLPGSTASGRAPQQVSAPLVLGLTDPAGTREHGLLAWSGRGLLGIAGSRGSGRSTAVATVVQAALAAGWEAHVITAAGGPSSRVPSTGTGGEPTVPAGSAGLGTLVGTDDPRRIARLLTALTSRPARPCLVAVDDVATVVRALETVPRGLGVDLFTGVLRDGPHHGVAVVVAGEPRDVLRWAPGATARLVLAVADAADDALLGVPREVTGGRRPPGRGVWVHQHTGVRCQVARPDAAWPPGPPAAGPALRLAPIPLVVEPRAGVPGTPAHGVTTTAPASDGAWAVPVGVGGDDAGQVRIDVGGGLLVVGPSGGGRSTAMGTVLQGLLTAGLRVGVLATEGPLAQVHDHPLGGHPGLAGWTATTLSAATELVGRCGRHERDVLLVDDADRLCCADPALDEALAEWVLRRASGVRDRPAVVAAARTDRAAAAYRGLLAALRGTATLVLAPLEPGSSDVAGIDLTAASDPARPRHPGRGVVVRAGRVTPVQVIAWRTPPPSG